MAYLKYYEKERADFPEEFGTFLDIKTANKIIKKLIGHFRIKTHKTWRFGGGKSSHCVTWKNTGQGHFKFSKTNTSIGVICHELAHAIEMGKRKASTHATRHYNIMKRLIMYCRKKGFVEKEITIVANGTPRVGMSTMGIHMAYLILKDDI